MGSKTGEERSAARLASDYSRTSSGILSNVVANLAVNSFAREEGFVGV